MIFKYSHMDWMEGIEEPNIEKGEHIYLWGAGKVGSVVAHALKKRGVTFEAFVDSSKDKQGKFYCGHEIISPEQFYQKDKNSVVICSCAFPNVMDEIREKGYLRVYNPVALLKEVDFSGYEGDLTEKYIIRMVESALRNYALYYKKGIPIERLLLVITEKCSLNCKNCDGYIPYHSFPQNDSLQTVINSYERVMEVCGSVDYVDVFGGEPLVHPNIEEIVKHLAVDTRCGNVTVISNGTIIPSNELLNVLKNPKCIFRISDYGKLSSKKEQLIEIFEQEGIKYEITNYQYWDSIPQIQVTGENSKQLDSKFANCTVNAFYIKQGKLTCCTFVSGLISLDNNLLPNFDRNYINLLDNDSLKIKQDIIKFVKQLHNRKHIDACKYCPGSHCIQFENKQPVAEQADGILPIENLFKDGKRI